MKKSKVMFICHGNICRSPMAEFILKHLLKEEGLENDYEVTSRATSAEELGNGIYPPAARTLDKHGIPYGQHRAKRMTADDYNNYDLLLYMDSNNLSNIRRFFEDEQGKVLKLGFFGLGGADIEDPWYTGNFELVYLQIYTCCKKLIEYLKEQNN